MNIFPAKGVFVDPEYSLYSYAIPDFLSLEEGHIPILSQTSGRSQFLSSQV